MGLEPMAPAKKASFVIFAFFLAATVVFRLGDVVLAGLFSFMILDLTHRRLAPRLPRFYERIVCLLLFVIVAAALFRIFGHFFRLALHRMPDILLAALPKIDEFGNKYGLFDVSVGNANELRAFVLDSIKENSQFITKASGVLTKGFFQIVMGIFIAMLRFMSDSSEPSRPNLFDAVRREFDQRMKVFLLGFEKVFGAQFLISTINTGLTGFFVIFMAIPYPRFLILATFILGLIPVVGNILSNTIIVGAAVMVSPSLALGTLGGLVILHKVEFFVYSRIVGESMDTPMWQILLAVLIGEAVLGIAGMVLAPALLHYIREEMQALKYQEA